LGARGGERRFIMKLFTRMKFIGPIGLSVVGAIAAVAVPSSAAPKAIGDVADDRVATSDEPEKQGRSTGSEQESESESEVHGPVGLIGGALAKLELEDEQRARLEKIGEQIGPKEHKLLAARHELMSELAEQVEEGKIDEHELDEKIDDLVKAREEASPGLRKALEDVHGVLDEKQRAALSDAIDTRMKELADGSREWFEEFAKDLRLSDDQKDRIHKVLDKVKPDLEKERATVEEVFEAFKKKDFTVESVVPISEVGKRTRARAHRMVAIAKDIVPILTPEQRADLGKRIEKAKESKESKGEAKEHEHDKPGPSADDSMPGEAQQRIVAGRSVRVGAVRGWGGGYAARSTTVRTGYAAGYPFVGGWGPGVW
jgi:Spy/CpxP family protein refolding chaperone